MIFVTKQHSLFADEYNQLTEVVYHVVYGNTLLSFEWVEGLRGLLLIECYAWPLRILNLLGLDTAFFVRYNIYVLHILYLIFGDFYFLKFGQAYLGTKSLDLAFLLRVTSAIYADFMSRPFGNTVEEILFLCGAYYFKRVYDGSSSTKHIWRFALVVPVSFLIRNTAAILWFPPLIWILVNKPRLIPFFFATTIPLFLFSLVNDYRFYGRWLIPFIQFATFNHDKFWHESPLFFIVVAVPAFLTLLTPATVLGGFQYFKRSRETQVVPWLVYIPALYIAFYSLNPHKEIRFILPIVPILIFFAAQYLQSMFAGTSKVNAKRIVGVHLVVNAIVTLFLTQYIKVFPPIISAVKANSEIKDLYVFSWYDFPLYSEFHGSPIKIEHEVCELVSSSNS